MRKFRVGGIENAGNSCIFSVMLQELAALPQIYDPLLYRPIKGSAQAAKLSLQGCIEKIRSGKLVERAEIQAIATQFQEMGWHGYLSSFWQCFLNRIAPELFPLSHFDAHELYELALQFLTEETTQPPQIILSGKETTETFAEFFASRSDLLNGKSPLLWRVALRTPQPSFEERFQIGTSEFSLHLIHAYRMTPYGKHVVVYRKVDEEWLCCDDAEITAAKPTKTDHIYAVVYESRPV